MKRGPVIFEFDSVQAFLEGYYHSLKKRRPLYSLTLLSRRMGMKSNASLLKLLSRERGIGPKLALQLETYFHFDDGEREYFRLLLLLDGAGLNSETRRMILGMAKEVLIRREKIFILTPEEGGGVQPDPAPPESLPNSG